MIKTYLSLVANNTKFVWNAAERHVLQHHQKPQPKHVANGEADGHDLTPLQAPASMGFVVNAPAAIAWVAVCWCGQTILSGAGLTSGN